MIGDTQMSSIPASTATLQPGRAGLSSENMYFPPPPAYNAQPPTTTTTTKKSIPFTFSFKSQTQTQSQPRPSTSSSTSTSSITSSTPQKPPKPILKKSVHSTKRTRQWILLSLLLLSFTILILSVIFAYCAALPHSDNIADAQASEAAAAGGFNGPVTMTVGLGGSAAATGTATPTPVPESPYEQPASDPYPPSLRLRDTPTISTPQDQQMTSDQIDAALARDAQNQARFSTTHAQVALTFYTATLPLLTILHTGIELLISLVRPETSQGTKMGDILLLRNTKVNSHTVAAAAATNAIHRRRVGALLSFSVSTLLLLGWIVMQLFTLNCEIVTFGSGGEGVCPVQIRGHRMGGISELSVGKVVLGFAVVGGYVGYCGFLVGVVGVGGGRGGKGGAGGVGGSGRRVGGFRRRARFVSGEERGGEGDVESVVIGIEGVEGESGNGSGKAGVA